MFKVYLKTMVKRFCQFYCADVDHNLRFYNFSDFTWVDLTYRPSVITLYVCYILAIRNLWHRLTDFTT